MEPIHCSSEGETQRVYFQVKKTRREKKFVCSLASAAVASEKDLYPIGGQAWQKGDDRGSVVLWGLSATHKSPTWKSYKDWHWMWHRAIGRQAVCVEMRGNRHADSGKEIRLYFVSQSLPHYDTTIYRRSDRKVKD
ncbi:hypothetical protein ABVT39_023272 [Epinephelus coioides]